MEMERDASDPMCKCSHPLSDHRNYKPFVCMWEQDYNTISPHICRGFEGVAQTAEGETKP